MSVAANANPHPSDSRVQREVELAMVSRLGDQHRDWRRLEWSEAAVGLALPPVWRKAKPDAVWRTGSEFIVAECYARLGKLESGHRRKLAMDALKLVALVNAVPVPHRVSGLLIVPTELNERLAGEGWFVEALRLVRIVAVTLSDEERMRLNSATELQAKGQARSGSENRRGEG